MKLTKTELLQKLEELNKNEINEDMRLGKIKPNSSEAVEAINRYNQRSKTIGWIKEMV